MLYSYEFSSNAKVQNISDSGINFLPLYYTISIFKIFEKMILSTTPTLEGHPIKEYKGVVTGETIIGANVIKDFMAGLTDFFGGRSTTYEKVLIEAKNTALEELQQRALAMGANAVVGIDLDYETVGSNGGMLMVTASGTAVVI